MKITYGLLGSLSSGRRTGLPNFFRRFWVVTYPKRTTSTGMGHLVPSFDTLFVPSTMTMNLPVRSSVIFSRKRAPPLPLVSWRSSSTSSAPSMVRSIFSTSLISLRGMPRLSAYSINIEFRTIPELSFSPK